MKLLGGSEDGVGRPPNRLQDEAAVGYVFQGHPHDSPFQQFVPKQSRWLSGSEDAIIEVSFSEILLSVVVLNS